jgi:hypothetical protein
MTIPLPSSWTLEDIKFLIEQVEKYPVVLVNLPELGIPTVEYTLTVTGAEQVEAGIVRVHTPECVFLFDIRKKTPSGKTWDCVKMVSGTYPYDKATVLARLETFLPKCEPPAQPAAVAVAKPAITLSLPLGWEQADIRFLIKQIKKGTIVMVYDPALGIPSILDIPEEAITDCGNGESRVKTQGYEGKFSIERTPSGKAWMHLKISAGFPQYSREQVLDTLHAFTADNDQKPSPDPVPAELPWEAVPTGPFELDPLELQILPPDDFFPLMPEEPLDNAPPVNIKVAEIAEVPAPAKKSKIIRLVYTDQESRIVARGDGLIAVCRCRGNGDKRTYGPWYLYYEDFLGVVLPNMHQQISAPSLYELTQKYGQAYNLEVIIDGALGALGIPVEMPIPKESEVPASTTTRINVGACDSHKPS